MPKECNMALLFAGISSDTLPPNINKRTYVYGRFEKTESGQPTSASAEAMKSVNDAWKHVGTRAAIGTCNEYFQGLSRGLSLRQVLDQGPITVWLLRPREGYTVADMPIANSAGRDIGINPSLLESGDRLELVCTLIHELAHVAGASTNNDKDDPHSLDAEKALKKCNCGNKYNKENLGYHIRTHNASKYQVV
jgi:hypothetical protein